MALPATFLDWVLLCEDLYDYDTINPQEYIDGYVGREDRTMSIVVGLIGKDGIVLATDSRMTSVTPTGEVITHDDHCVKLWNIENKLAIANASNLGGWESQIIEIFEKNLKGSDYNQLCNEFTSVLRTEFEDAIKPLIRGIKNKEDADRVIATISKNLMEFVLVGYQDNKPVMKRVSFLKGMITLKHTLSQNGYITGAWDIARYWMPKFRDSLHLMSSLELKRLATFLVCESANYLDSIGGDIQMITLQNDNELKQVPQYELRQMIDDVHKAMDGGVKTIVYEFQQESRGKG